MLRSLVVHIAILLLGLLACKDQTKSAAPKPGSASGVAVTGDAPTATEPVGSGSGSVLRLPKLAGTPPVKTTKPIDAAKAQELAKIEFESFTRDVRVADAKGIDLRYFTKARPTIMVTVNATKCFDCLPMEESKWRAKSDALKYLIGPELKDHRDTTWELGMTEIAKTPYAWTYHVAYNVAPDTIGVAGSYATAYAIYYNDGVNMIRVVAEYKDDAPKSREAMLAMTPKQDLEQIAKAFVDVFDHAW